MPIRGKLIVFSLLFLNIPLLAQAPVVPTGETGESVLTFPWFWAFIICGLCLGIACVFFMWNLKLSRELSKSFEANKDLEVDLENQVKERTIGIVKINEQINQEISELQKENKSNKELIAKLKDMLEVKSKEDFLPICSHCKNIRDNNGYWHSIEEFIHNLSDSDLSHTLCPECTKELYPELFEDGAKPFCLSWKPGSDNPL